MGAVVNYITPLNESNTTCQSVHDNARVLSTSLSLTVWIKNILKFLISTLMLLDLDDSTATVINLCSLNYTYMIVHE